MCQNRKNLIWNYLRLLRFESWIGWLFNFMLGTVLFALFPSVTRFFLLTLSFALSTAGVFVLNQYFDRNDDKFNRSKSHFPVSSGEISPKNALTIYLLLTFTCVCFVAFVDIDLLFLFICYIGLWICYSAPPVCLKKRPIIDVFVAGFGSGFLPFIMGLQVSSNFSLEFSLPWVRRYYQDAFYCVLPLLFFQSSTHILQEIGDYEADLKTDAITFVVKYGKKNSMRLAEFFLIISALLPILYWFLNLSLTDYFYWYLMVFVLVFPFMCHVMNLLRKSSANTIEILRSTSRKLSPPLLFIVWVYALILRTNIP